MTKHIHTNSIKEAWKVTDELFPTDYSQDSIRTNRAGYDVYTGSTDPMNYICDLGDRLEINLADGQTINIWIDAEDVTRAAAEALKTVKVAASIDPQVVLKISVCVEGYNFASKEEKALYEALVRNPSSDLAFDIIQRYCEQHSIPCGSIEYPHVHHVKGYNPGTGHFVLISHVKARIGEELNFSELCTASLHREYIENANRA